MNPNLLSFLSAADKSLFDVLISWPFTKIEEALQLYWQRDWDEEADGVSKGVRLSGNKIDWPIKRPFLRLDIKFGWIAKEFLSFAATELINNKPVLSKL